MLWLWQGISNEWLGLFWNVRPAFRFVFTQFFGLRRVDLDGTIRNLELPEPFCPVRLKSHLLTGDSSLDLFLLHEDAQPAFESR